MGGLSAHIFYGKGDIMQGKILKLLLDAEGYISGQAISEKLNVSRQAVNKSIMSLRNKGYEVESVTNKGYLLKSCPNVLNEELIKYHLNTSVMGKKIKVLDSVTSTNDYLKKLGAKGEEHGTIIVAREQTAGKGRLGRVWQTKKDDGIAFSVILRPELSPVEVSSITPLSGLAVCKAINDFCMLDSKIKWPNDVIVGKKKLVGILTEMSAEFDKVEYIVIGIGINVEHTVFPAEIAHKATSILLETGRHIDKNKFLVSVITNLEKILFENNYRLTGAVLKDYTDHCATIGRQVTFTRGSRNITGMAVSISNSGELEVMLSNGTIVTVNSGEVTVQGIY
ncbi:MAG: biotin--[acetyl-CoA-carboxylase] ligase [Oscillospiraceae bacterium]|nr:biotin--[acetyl-CoA-carboxylase] ligase [Oscillospiraceae bacterium]